MQDRQQSLTIASQCKKAARLHCRTKEAAEHGHREAKTCFRAFERSDNRAGAKHSGLDESEGTKHSELVDAKLLTKKMREEVEGNSCHAVSESSGPASPAEAELD